MIRKYLFFIALSACTFTGFAQKSYNEQVQDYIAQYKSLAITEQQRTGIPASITLAQGIFETAAGSSELCQNASNHFGIKCKNTWTGETYTYTDDAKDECFRKYVSAVHSYKDHSDFLKNNKRYSSLFDLSPTDYAAWAYGLKRCGYATNPQYAKKLIKTIEDFRLQEYTYAALNNNNDDEILLASAKEIPLPRKSARTPGEHIPADDGYGPGASAAEQSDELYVEKASYQEQASGNVTDYYRVTTKNNIKGFYGKKGDMLLEYAIKNKIRYAKLLELNDLPDAPLEADMFVYLERKAKTAQNPTHTMEDGETLIQVAQQEGIQLQQLRLLNHLEKGEEPVSGTVLNLQTTSESKPELYTAGVTRKNTYKPTKSPRLSNDDGFVPAGKKPESVPEVNIGDEPETTTAEAQAAANNDRVNIANERPVEETIAEERRNQAPAKDESKMTPLEKLKAHMDKTVYANRDFEPKTSGHYEETAAGTEEAVTVPARNNTRTVETARRATKEEQKTAGQKKGREQVKPKAKAKAKSHTVRKGESLFEIAQKYDLSVSELQKMNKQLHGNKKIQPGMKLKVAK
ncbi:glucosaminidase domain-containing protein [Taibaiella koreensis]|uniref:glucosaminidase domain-containing protein n=1 Tax=Taibaiella koreensis TaxID=1268548 RepID=UPI000E59BABA|nr:glucosaminidase domain-containing protein [Taibaiella koreensis]